MASTMASCTSGRTARIACDERSGQVRLVRSVTDSLRLGSIHSDVPVNPRCPNDEAVKREPDDDGCEGVSQPRARDEPGVERGHVW